LVFGGYILTDNQNKVESIKKTAKGPIRLYFSGHFRIRFMNCPV
jgi:hypothetical protein